MDSVAPAGVAAIGQPASEFLAMLEAALSTRSQLGWSRWLQGEIQSYLPHDALVAAWGMFPTGEVAYDVITRAPGLSMGCLPKDVIEPLLATLFQQWLDAGQNPLAVDTRALRSVGCTLFASSPCALVHGVQDRRSRHDCLYLFAGPASLASPFSRQVCRMALPYIDTAFRQVADRGQDNAQTEPAETGFATSSFAACPFNERIARGAAASAQHVAARADAMPGGPGSVLSNRELEVMKWVRMGKTNSEIAMILHLSTFTVKNHMRRIYKKLDVLNRAQAVSNVERMHPIHHPARD